jgi:hypothetical protein
MILGIKILIYPIAIPEMIGIGTMHANGTMGHDPINPYKNA